jgi:inner membrane protein
MDATNSYGVHPFWPFDNRWYYGDAVFIVEPLFWAACAPLVFVVRSMTAKVLIGLTLIAGVVLSFTAGMVPVLMSTALVILTIAMLVLGKLASKQVALVTGLAVWFATNAAFAQASGIARRTIEAIAAQNFPNAKLLDVVLTPMPANPVCWQLLLVQVNGDQWYVRRAAMSIAPDVIASNACPSRGNVANTTAPFTPIAAPSNATITWHGEIGMSRARLIEWVQRDCQAGELMRFARAPWLAQRDSTWILGDARFDNEPELSFAEIELGTGARCMARVPPWEPPRVDLLGVGR